MEQTTVNEIHGHDIIDLIRSAPAGLTEAALTEAVNNRFGINTRFHTCKAAGMTLSELMQFLFSRNKVVAREGKLWVVEENVCNHG